MNPMLVGLLALLACAWSAPTDDLLVTIDTLTHTTEFVEFLKKSGLRTVLQGPGPYTVFAPSNAAFSELTDYYKNKLLNDTTELTKFMKYYIVNGMHPYSEFYNEQVLTALTGEKIIINKYHNTDGSTFATAEGAEIVNTDIKATNGIVHTVEDVMLAPEGSFMDYFPTDPELSTFLNMVKIAGFQTTLNESPYTVFAPTNAAWSHLGNATLTHLQSQPVILKELLQFHTIHGTLFSIGMLNHEYVKTLYKGEELLLTVNSFGTVELDFRRLVELDIDVSNGVLHKLTSVLIPRDLSAQVHG